jgi:hypothetical protein
MSLGGHDICRRQKAIIIGQQFHFREYGPEPLCGHATHQAKRKAELHCYRGACNDDRLAIKINYPVTRSSDRL